MISILFIARACKTYNWPRAFPPIPRSIFTTVGVVRQIIKWIEVTRQLCSSNYRSNEEHFSRVTISTKRSCFAQLSCKTHKYRQVTVHLYSLFLFLFLSSSLSLSFLRLLTSLHYLTNQIEFCYFPSCFAIIESNSNFASNKNLFLVEARILYVRTYKCMCGYVRGKNDKILFSYDNISCFLDRRS